MREESRYKESGVWGREDLGGKKSRFTGQQYSTMFRVLGFHFLKETYFSGYRFVICLDSLHYLDINARKYG